MNLILLLLALNALPVSSGSCPKMVGVSIPRDTTLTPAEVLERVISERRVKWKEPTPIPGNRIKEK